MALQNTPHTVSVYAPTRTGGIASDYETINDEAATPASVVCQITPLSPSKAFESYGVEIDAPHLIFANIGAEAYLIDGARVVFGSRVFFVKGSPKVWEANLPVDHVQALLEEYVAVGA